MSGPLFDAELLKRIETHADERMAAKVGQWGPDVMRYVEKTILLQTLDHLWREHLVMLDHLRQVIGLRGYGQRDPLQEYKSEAFTLFEAMIAHLREAVTAQLMRVEIVPPEEQQPVLPPMQAHHANPTTGEENLPDRFFIWWRGNEQLVNVEGGSNLEVDFAIQEAHLDAVAIAKSQSAKGGASLFDFSLYSLPIQTQAVYAVLLMIPIGALIMVVLRNMIGVDAFGTFMPVLIALAFRETKLFWGVMLFTLLVALGLSIRFLLDRLRLLLVPRLSAVLIVVVGLMLVISLVSHRLGMETGLSVALFPMVIIAMTIERMSVVWEERGAADAIRAGLGSLAIAITAYIFMGLAWLEHLILTFPELLLVVLAVVMLVGRDTGYRLLELRRFKALTSD